MKKTFKHRLTTWLMTLGFASACGVVAVGSNYMQQYNKTDAYTVEKNQGKVTFSKEELNNCNYSYLTTLIQNETFDTFVDTYIIYNNTRLNCYDFDNSGQIAYLNDEGDYPTGDDIKIVFNNDFTIYIDDMINNTEFYYSLTIYSSFFAENMQKSVTLSASQLNNNTYEYFSNKLDNLDDNTVLSYNYIIYNNEIYHFDEDDGETLQFNDTNGNNISFDYIVSKQWSFVASSMSHTSSFNNSILIFSNFIADNLYAPFTDGDDIIGGITSGLGLITYIATAFLNGFTGLFYVNGQLTNFAIYSLVMLGIAICFSVIKLCMNVMRSNTGA